MKQKLSILLLLLINCFLIQSCKKENLAENKEPYHYYFSRHALDYVMLTEGKYLIYKDSATSLIDSVIVTKSLLENIYTAGEPLTWDAGSWFAPPANYREKFSLNLTKYDGTSQSEWLYAYAGSYTANVYNSSDTCSVELYQNAGAPSRVFYLSESSTPNYSITVEGRTYNNVIVSTDDNGVDPTSPYYEKITYYWAKQVGIIKRTLINGTDIKTYTLLRNN